MAKILLIEDNEMNRDMLARRLERRGHTILLAFDGAEGVHLAQTINPDLILMDLSLPVLDGWEATKQLKQSPHTCAIPIIALTAHALADDRQKSLAVGCDEYETKPIDFPRLLAKIDDLLQKGACQ